ncbi:ankyrin repeat domain-containing protein 10-like isoform X2 [Ornithodoros turicata]|uniref:ankyrin repeat domain-containing protein 10-like isoform X2 n=1 Tax=Ornithodoros turicata TaxID=34597 RepID=UPI003138A03B
MLSGTLQLHDADGESPLHKAARAGNVECAHHLLSAGCNPRLLNRWGQSSSQLALQLGHLPVATLLNAAEQGIFTPLPCNILAANNRKRSHDKNGYRGCKKFRTSDEPEIQSDIKPVPQMLTSAQDYGQLMHVEQGYNRIFVDNWISEVHGC